MNTPGPWFVTSDGYRVYSKNGGLFDKMICMTAHNNSERTRQAKDNATLCAAAPELLEALKYVRDNAINDSVEMWEMVDKAIAKAEGV